MQKFIYDIDRKVFRNTNGLVRTGFRPSLSYGEHAVWQIEIQATDTGEVSLGDASAWRAAIDQDFTASTEPMARTSSGISVDASGEWPVATVSIDTRTERFQACCDGRQTTPAFFELAGLDGAGDTVFYLCFPVDALFPIDPVAAGTLPGVNVTYLTEDQVRAIASAAGADAAMEAAGNVDDKFEAHAAASSLHVPEGGSAGQLLTKTDAGAKWADAPSGGGSSSGDSIDLSNYYTKSQTDALLSEEAEARTSAVNAMKARVEALEQGGTGASAGVIPVEELPSPSAINAGKVYLVVGTGHVWQSKGIGSADALGVRLSGSISFAGDYLPTGDTTTVTYQDMGTLEQVSEEYPVYSNGEKYLFAIVNSYALAPLYAVGASLSAPEYYAPSADIGTLTGDWYNSDYTGNVSVMASQYELVDITATELPDGGTSGQVLTKTDTGAQWADAPASSGSSGEASTDAGAVRYVSTLEDYEAICAMASSTSSGGVVPFISLEDISLASDYVLSPGLNTVSSSLKRGHTYLRINAEFTIPFISFKDATVRRIEQRTYYIEKFWIVNPSGSQIDNWALRAWRNGVSLLAGNPVASEAGNEYGYGWTDRTECRDVLQWYRNGLWPTVQTDPAMKVSEFRSLLEKDDTYLGTNPDDLTSAGTNGATLKRINGVWRKGHISRDSSMNLVESFDMDTAYTIQFMYQTSSGSLDTALQVMKTVTIEETWSSPLFWETVPEEIKDSMELTGDITPGLPKKAEEVEYASSMEIRPGDCLSVALSGNVTLSAMGGVDGARQTASIDICPGSHALTAGDGLSLVDSLVSEKLNHCEIRWWGAKATLHVLFTEDAPSGGSGEEGGGSESGGETGGDTPSDGWPAKIIVSNVSSSFDADVSAYAGTYTRTGETLTVLGEAIPIWSNGSKFIYGVSTSMGFDLEEPAIALYDQKGSNDAYVSYAYRMKSDASTAWTMGDSANACGMSATITEE